MWVRTRDAKDTSFSTMTTPSRDIEQITLITGKGLVMVEEGLYAVLHAIS